MNIALLGEYNSAFPPHLATSAAIAHSCSFLKSEVESNWISTEDINPSLFENYIRAPNPFNS